MIGIAILETDPMVRSIIEGYVARIDGYRVEGTTDSLQKAAELYAQGKIQLLISESRLPDGSLADWLAQQRGTGKPLDVIVVTGDTSYATFCSLMHCGLIDYILKPFTYTRFRESLKRYKKYTDKISPESELSQSALDGFFFAEGGTKRKNIKAFSPRTYEQVLAYMKKNASQSFSATDLADAMGVSRITARRYLELMVSEKVVNIEMRYGKVGRPKNIYYYSKEKKQ